MLKIISLIVTLIYLFYLPGFLIYQLGFKRESLFATFTVSVGLSLVLIPIFSFGLAVLLHTTVQRNLIFATSTVINLICLIMILHKKAR